jgi:hypothetical protein
MIGANQIRILPSWRKTFAISPTARPAAIDAALGILGGSLRINASQIDGLLAADQIDINSVGTALESSATFLETLKTLVKLDECAR